MVDQGLLQNMATRRFSVVRRDWVLVFLLLPIVASAQDVDPCIVRPTGIVDCSVFETLVPGMWKIGSPDAFAAGTAYDAEFFNDGTGVYRISGTEYGFTWEVHPWNTRLPATWSLSYAPLRPLGVEPGCILYDRGFWHVGYSGVIRSNLQEPLTGFEKYQLGGPFDNGSGDYFGHDLSQEVVSVIYRKQ